MDVALNKPKGYLCTNYDKLKRPIAIDLLKGAVNTRLFHVGRLDFNSSGLIFYTNDGDFAEIVSHPSYEIEMPEYKLLQIKIHNKKLKSLTGRANTQEAANIIKSHIEAEFLTGNTVSFKALMKKFKKLDLKQPTMSNHLSKVKKELIKKGHKIEKISPGKYKII